MPFTSRPGFFSSIPPIIRLIIITNATVYIVVNWILELLTLNGIPISNYIIEYFALQPIGSTFPLFYIWQLITYQFLHGGFFHIFMNMFILWMFGAELEYHWGSKRFLAYYLLSGIGAGLIHLFVSPLFSYPAPTIGASGAIYGILLAFALMFPNRLIIVFPFFFPVPARILIFGYIIFDLISGISQYGGNIAHFAHVGGALCGWFLLKFGERTKIFPVVEKILEKIVPPSVFYGPFPTQREHPHRTVSTPPPSSETAQWFRISEPQQTPKQDESNRSDLEREVDRILEKIEQYGYQSLTDEEKRTLYEASRKL